MANSYDKPLYQRGFAGWLQRIEFSRNCYGYEPFSDGEPYALKGARGVREGEAASLPMRRGNMYLRAIIDWYSRYVVAWEISNTLDGAFCREVLRRALQNKKPSIFNTDQGAQFTSPKFTEILQEAEVQISMDGKGRALDNVFVERLWRSVKYEHIYLHSYENGLELYHGLHRYFEHYNNERPHQSLGNQKPSEVYHATEA